MMKGMWFVLLIPLGLIREKLLPPFLHIASFALPEPASAPVGAFQCPPLPSPARHDPEVIQKKKTLQKT